MYEPCPVFSGIVPACTGGKAHCLLCLASLPSHYQDVLREKYVDALPVDEIARRRRATPKSVESTLGRARRAFQKTFELLAGGWREGWRHAGP